MVPYYPWDVRPKARRRGRSRVIDLLSVALLLATFLCLPTSVVSEEPLLPPADPSIGRTDFHQILIVQGDDPDTTEAEPRNLIIVTERTFWRVPWDSDTVYTYIPPKAENVLIDHVQAFSHQGKTFFIPGDYSASANPHDPPSFGRSGNDPYAGMAFWKFPAGADRTDTNSLSFETDDDWLDYDENHTSGEDWRVVFDSLSLEENVTSSTYTSKKYTGGKEVASVNMSVVGEYKDNMTFEISLDNGTNWHHLTEGQPLGVMGEGNEFRWRVSMTQNSSMDINPIIDDVIFEITFVPYNTEIWLETTYHLRVPRGGSIETYMMFPFDGEFSGIIFVGYFDRDMLLEVTGTNVVPDDDQEDPGRTVYLHMQGPFEKVLTLEVKDEKDYGTGAIPAWLLFAIPLVLVMLVAAAYILRKGTGEVQEPGAVDRTRGDGGPGPELFDEEELMGMKAEILSEIAQLDRQLDEGLIDEDHHTRRRAELKAEAVEVMRELEKDSR